MSSKEIQMADKKLDLLRESLVKQSLFKHADQAVEGRIAIQSLLRQRDELLAACKGLLKLGIFKGLDNPETRNASFATIHALRDQAQAAIASVEGSQQ